MRKNVCAQAPVCMYTSAHVLVRDEFNSTVIRIHTIPVLHRYIYPTFFHLMSALLYPKLAE